MTGQRENFFMVIWDLEIDQSNLMQEHYLNVGKDVKLLSMIQKIVCDFVACVISLQLHPGTVFQCQRGKKTNSEEP